LAGTLPAKSDGELLLPLEGWLTAITEYWKQLAAAGWPNARVTVFRICGQQKNHQERPCARYISQVLDWSVCWNVGL